MRHCPVCDQQYETVPCPGCGFDESCSWETYPTLAPVPGGTEAISARRAALNGVFRCPGCGGTHFYVRIAEKAVQCTRCGRREPPAVPAAPSEETSLPRQSVALGANHTVAARGSNLFDRFDEGAWRAILEEFYRH